MLRANPPTESGVGGGGTAHSGSWVATHCALKSAQHE